MTASGQERVAAACRDRAGASSCPPGQRAHAGQDHPLPIGYGQTNSQPTTVRQMLAAARRPPG